MDADLDIIDRLRGREPVEWRERFRKRRDEFIAHMQVEKDAREKARHANTRPAHELAAYAGDYESSGLRHNVDSREQDGALQWSWRGMFATMTHRHYETFELPEVPDRLLPDRACHHLPDRSRRQHCQSLGAARALVKDIVFARQAAG